MNPIHNPLRRLRERLLARHTRGQRAIAAMEFALTLPIWVTMLLGCTDGAMLMLLSQRVDRIAYTVCDIVTQSQTVSKTDLSNILLAGGELMQPYSFGDQGRVIVSSLYKPAGAAAKINWQYSGGGTMSRSSKIGQCNTSNVCTTPVMPGTLTLNDNENVIVVEVFYAFKPMFLSAGLLTSGDIYRTAVYKPRLSPLITAPI